MTPQDRSTRSNGTQDALEPQFEYEHLGQTADGHTAPMAKETR